MAETFDNFMVHKRESVEYQNNTTRVELGNGYSYTSKPQGPLLKKFTLSFTGYRLYYNSDGTLDLETNKTLNNAGALISFYETMNLCETFIYNDQQYGAVPVRFSEPIVVPVALGPYSVLDTFKVILQEVSE